MRKEDLVVGALCLATAAWVLAESVSRYFGDRGELGAGAYPSYVAILLAACGASIILQWVTGNRDTSGKAFLPTGNGRKRLAYQSGALVVHRVATDLLGFGLASLILMIFQMRTLGRHRWRTIILLSFAFVLSVSYTFREWLYMALPRGILGL
ncbi:MAG: tripartite tricarboxylate transporter TctB family protein [Chloroflexota bacterium]